MVSHLKRPSAGLILFGLAILVLPATSPVAGQMPSGHVPNRSEARRIDSVFARLDNVRSPGCALGITDRDGLVFTRGYGMANLEHGIAIGPETVFRTGSVAKQFTAAVIVLLAEEGMFSLDDPLRAHFPELPELYAPVTIRHLLHHTSGIRDYLELMAMRGIGDEATYTEDDVVDLLVRQEGLNFEPGAAYRYSNSGYLLLSRLVERTTGATLREQGERLLFGPLGMGISHFHDDHKELVSDRANGYALGSGGSFVRDETTLDLVGDGGVYTSIEEMAHWITNFWNLEVGGEGWLETMETRGVLNSGEVIDYAVGLSHGTQRGIQHVGHGGAFVGYRAATLRYPSEDLGIAVLCNYALTDPMGMALQVGEILLESKMNRDDAADRSGSGPSGPRSEPAPPLSEEEMAAFSGTYYSKEVNSTFRIFRGERGLMVDVNGGWEFRLLPDGPDRLHGEFLTLSFYRDAGQIAGFNAGSGRAGGVRFVRR